MLLSQAGEVLKSALHYELLVASPHLTQSSGSHFSCRIDWKAAEMFVSPSLQTPFVVCACLESVMSIIKPEHQ